MVEMDVVMTPIGASGVCVRWNWRLEGLATMNGQNQNRSRWRRFQSLMERNGSRRDDGRIWMLTFGYGSGRCCDTAWRSRSWWLWRRRGEVEKSGRLSRSLLGPLLRYSETTMTRKALPQDNPRVATNELVQERFY
jgi:hypothetical protein